MDYQPAKFQYCSLSLASFIDKLRKNIMVTSSLRHFMFLDLKISNFVKQDIGYHVAKFEIS